MKIFKKMGHQALEVSDLKRSLEFYRDTLGLEAFWTKSDDWANLKLGGDDLSLLVKGKSKHPPHLGLRVSSLEELQAAHQHLKAHKVDIDPIKGHRDGSQTFYFRDPDGNILEAVYDPNS